MVWGSSGFSGAGAGSTVSFLTLPFFAFLLGLGGFSNTIRWPFSGVCVGVVLATLIIGGCGCDILFLLRRELIGGYALK